MVLRGKTHIFDFYFTSLLLLSSFRPKLLPYFGKRMSIWIVLKLQMKSREVDFAGVLVWEASANYLLYFSLWNWVTVGIFCKWKIIIKKIASRFMFICLRWQHHAYTDRFNVLSEQAVSSYPCLGCSPQVNIFYMSVLRKQDSVA